MKEKIYKRIIYWVNTVKFCGAVAVDQDGKIYPHDTAPCYRWAAKRNMTFQDFKNYLNRNHYLITIKKLDDEIDPF